MQKYFIVKYDRYDKEDKYIWKTGTLVEYIARINNFILVECCKTKKRKWIANYDIYPINNHDQCGEWIYNKKFQEIADKVTSNKV